jgi:hypothetical protein
MINEKLKSEMEAALQTEYDQRMADLDLEFSRRRSALKQVFGDFSPNGAGVKLPPRDKFSILEHVVPTPGEAPRSESVSMKRAAMEALREVSGVFSVRDLAPIAQRLYPKMDIQTSDLANPIWSLRKEGKIVPVDKGIGREPSTYRKA